MDGMNCIYRNKKNISKFGMTVAVLICSERVSTQTDLISHRLRVPFILPRKIAIVTLPHGCFFYALATIRSVSLVNRVNR